MIVMICAALLCALVLAIALHPLMTSNPKQGWRILIICAVSSLALYLALGSPDLPSAPAMFEISGDRYDARMSGRRELIIMEALSGQPDNVKLLLELGTIRVESNHPEEAIEVLTHARTLAPHDPRVLEALGAAHYKMAIIFAMQPRPEAQKLAQKNLAEALALTPKSSDLYKEIKKAAQGH